MKEEKIISYGGRSARNACQINLHNLNCKMIDDEQQHTYLASWQWTWNWVECSEIIIISRSNVSIQWMLNARIVEIYGVSVVVAGATKYYAATMSTKTDFVVNTIITFEFLPRIISTGCFGMEFVFTRCSYKVLRTQNAACSLSGANEKLLLLFFIWILLE